ncbi:hypothetical protein [Methylobacterium segetis]|uniref:hypothetical protein n=1 Tax=Methylobacterium segetis TaxID=2488750 RepID=UPI001044B557|nr:hypothetical protein [Methylobacterium segetis]
MVTTDFAGCRPERPSGLELRARFSNASPKSPGASSARADAGQGLIRIAQKLFMARTLMRIDLQA